MSTFSEKIDQLEQNTKKINGSVKSSENSKKYFPYIIGVGIATPILTSLILALLNLSSFMTVDETTGESIRNKKKIGIWTLVISLLVWCILFGVYYYTSM